ncbi:ThuA domain-containing protein [Myxococcota bacterium]|nr:ThuA domain-containing protein [Myxococcota bacterium]
MSRLRRVLLGIGVLVVVVVAAGLVGLRMIGAWNLVFTNRSHEVRPPELPQALGRPAFLVFTKTNGFRHKEAIVAGLERFEEIAQRRDWSLFATENGAVFQNSLLENFDAVVFHNASGDMLSSDQEAAFMRFLEDGGGWVGIHAAGDSSHEDWDWYVDNLIGGLFTAHTMGPQFQEARLVVEDADHPATRSLPDEWLHTEEWYSWDANPRDHGMRVLVSVDESTYSPWVRWLGNEVDLRMGDHPIVWVGCVGRGRTLYSALGHQGAAYETPEYRALLEGALAWAGRLEGVGCD